jgi:arylsulfatase
LTSNTYYEWYLARTYMLAAAAGIVEEFLKTFREYPPRQRAASFTIDQALEKMKPAMGGGGH